MLKIFFFFYDKIKYRLREFMGIDIFTVVKAKKVTFAHSKCEQMKIFPRLYNFYGVIQFSLFKCFSSFGNF